ncbi:hypothetical protein GCM10009097_59520 [Pigmentiphaga daeguensis]|uniref:Uncharacterized protein n=1 Tax=Pigmentiphaga daeguensis TaxID=414049 RepID=A0ABP3N669_9BURK
MGWICQAGIGETAGEAGAPAGARSAALMKLSAWKCSAGSPHCATKSRRADSTTTGAPQA